MIKIILTILLLGLTGCTQQQNFGGGVVTKEFEVSGEKILVGGEQMLGASKSDLISADFKPEVKLEKWGDETYVKVWSDETGDKTATQLGDKVVWNNIDKSKEYNFYAIEDGFEYEIILKEKPKSNIIELKIETKDLEFYYQPELTQEEIDDGAFRPDNVIGSYAVYHATKVNHIEGQTDYKAGKAFHIYRPQMVDAKGWKVWGDLHIEKGILTVTIPQDFLDKAVYPVKHATGLTFGYTSVGGTLIGKTDWMWGGSGTGVSGTATKFTAYTKSSTGEIRAFIVEASGKTIITNGSTGILTGDLSVASWKDFTFSTNPTITAQLYYLPIMGGNGGSAVMYYDTGLPAGNFYMFDSSNDFSSPTDPTDGGVSDNRNVSTYVTYTAGTSATSTRRIIITK